MRLIEALEKLAGSYGIGRGIHLGDTVLGTKGRVAFEAPAAITLITAHRELEKLVLSAQQARIKDSVAEPINGPAMRPSREPQPPMTSASASSKQSDTHRAD